jgi:hypothetical protein
LRDCAVFLLDGKSICTKPSEAQIGWRFTAQKFVVVQAYWAVELKSQLRV